MITQNLHVIDTDHGLYVNANDLIRMILAFHHTYPSHTTKALYNALAEARKEHYAQDTDISSDPIAPDTLDGE